MSMTAEAPTTQRRHLEVTDQHAADVPDPSTARARLGGLLAVSGLVGGAGTTTVAYLIALACAHHWAARILVADTGGPSGALAALSGVEARLSLPELADHLAIGLPLPNGVYATGPNGARVLAAGPSFSAPPAGEPLQRLLIYAREAHELTVVDCGTLSRDVDRAVAARATHIAWVMPASAHGLASARRVLGAAPALAGREIVVARALAGELRAPIKEIRRLAADRRAPLVLIPHIARLDLGRLDRTMTVAQVPLQAILGALRR